MGHMHMTNEQKVIYTMTWFQPEEWQKLKDAVDDPTTLDDSYENWKRAQNKR